MHTVQKPWGQNTGERNKNNKTIIQQLLIFIFYSLILIKINGTIIHTLINHVKITGKMYTHENKLSKRNKQK